MPVLKLAVLQAKMNKKLGFPLLNAITSAFNREARINASQERGDLAKERIWIGSLAEGRGDEPTIKLIG